MAAGRDESQIAHFLTLEALQEYQYRIFQPGAQLHYIGKASPQCDLAPTPRSTTCHTERPLVNYGSGMATATLRVRDDGTANFEEHLRHAFNTLYALYGPGQVYHS